MRPFMAEGPLRIQAWTGRSSAVVERAVTAKSDHPLALACGRFSVAVGSGAHLETFREANSEQTRRAVVVPLAQGRFQVTRMCACERGVDGTTAAKVGGAPGLGTGDRGSAGDLLHTTVARLTSPDLPGPRLAETCRARHCDLGCFEVRHHSPSP